MEAERRRHPDHHPEHDVDTPPSAVAWTVRKNRTPTSKLCTGPQQDRALGEVFQGSSDKSQEVGFSFAPRFPEVTVFSKPLRIAACLALALSAGCSGAAGDGDGASTSDSAINETAEWTVLVYGAFDTHDADGIPSSLLDMAQKLGVEPKQVKLLYLEDKPDEPNTKLYEVGRRKTTVVKDYGELHTGHAQTLTDVLHFVRETYPSRHVFLDLIGHTSSGLAAFMPDYTPMEERWEDQRMTYAQVHDAVLAGGGPVDVLALSGCGTGDLEIVARMGDVAKYVVGLQEYSFGYTDVRWADSLARNPQIDPAGLARRVAEGQLKLSTYSQGQPGAFGAYDTSRLPLVKVAFAEMNAAIAATPNVAELVAARKSAFEAQSEDFEAFVDAVDLAERIQAETTDEAVRAKAAAFAAALDSMMIAGGAPNYADDATHARAHGINVLFMRPGLGGRFADPDGFDQTSAWPVAETSFYEETGWRGVVTKAFDAYSSPPPPAPAMKGTIHVEVDYVGAHRLLPGALSILHASYASMGYQLDVVESDVLPVVDVLEHGDQSAQLRSLYTSHFDHRGQKGWHYLLVGDDLDDGSRGWGKMGGDILVFSAESVRSFPDYPNEAQANIFMHELGHNLGLTHEGFEPELSAGTHDPSTCATAAFPAHPVPATTYSPGCLAHVSLDSIALVP